MPTRNVVVTVHQHELIEELVRSGRYQNASEVLREGLRLVERQEAEAAVRLQTLREAADRGWADHDAGRFDEVAEVDVDAYVADLGRAAAAGRAGE